MAAALAGCSTLTSCFKEEPLNAECDIEQAYIHVDKPLEMFYQKNDTLLDVIPNIDYVNFIVRKNVDLTAFAPQFKLTDGATISPESGSVHDFSHGPVIYTTTSEDGLSHRTYSVTIGPDKDKTEYNFSNFYLEEDEELYYVWNDLDDKGNRLNNWATGNPGFSIAVTSAEPEDYPTVPDSDGPEHETCVKLTTRDTKTYGYNAHMPIAAGNIFLGKFNLGKAMTPYPDKDGVKGVLATEFGLPISAEPITFSGSYKYKRGNVFVNSDKETVPGKKDYGSIYAVFYENVDSEGKKFVLHGYDVLTSSQIISIANLGNIDDTDGWKSFNINFQIQDGKVVDANKLKNRHYSLAIVCSSSTEGASFQGAIGSTLWVDDLSIKCAENE